MRRRSFVFAGGLALAGCDKKEDVAPEADASDAKSDAARAYIDKAKTSEARVHVAKLFDAASAYFMEEHVERGAVMELGAGGLPTKPMHRCPDDGRLAGSVGPTPPMSVD